MIREKIIIRLIKSGKLTVVESAEDADASLTGIAEVTPLGAGYSANLVVRFVGGAKQILRTDDASPRGFGPRSVTSGVAERVVTDLLKAIAKDKKSK